MTGESTRPLAVVTGGSTGIGYELAIQFAKNGYDLIVAAHTDELDDACAALRHLDADVIGVRTDLATFDGVERLIEEVRRVSRPVEALALNAGVGASGAFVGGTSLEDELGIIQLNIASVVHLAKRLLPEMVARGRGRVLLTSSVASFSPGPFHAVYHASKAFVQSFGEAIRQELADTGVTVTCLLPGATETPFFARANMLGTKVGQGKKDDPALVAKQGFEALMSGKDQVVAGSVMNKVQGVVSRILPDSVKARSTAGANEPLEPGDEHAEDALAMLKRQHREAEGLFARISAVDVAEGQAIFKVLAEKLLTHMRLEEEVFYPAAEVLDQVEIANALDEHEEAKEGIAEILGLEAGAAKFPDAVRALRMAIEEHVEEEENGLFPLCEEHMTKAGLIGLADEMREIQGETETNGGLWRRTPSAGEPAPV